MDRIEKTSTHYVRCVKPNKQHAPLCVCSADILSQLVCSGKSSEYWLTGAHSYYAHFLLLCFGALCNPCRIRCYGGRTYPQGRLRFASAPCGFPVAIPNPYGQTGKVSEGHAIEGSSGSVGAPLLPVLQECPFGFQLPSSQRFASVPRDHYVLPSPRASGLVRMRRWLISERLWD